ncbi:signal peptidase II [Streptomyces sparsogenes]|uniref:signal peptidase II n=1 Tax=Streptomyces sparsogenes TaxID=67365 RepID=UPI00331FF95D
MTTSEAPNTDTPAQRRCLWLLWAVAGIAYVIDQGSKLAVVAGLEGHAPVPVVGTWLELRVQRNPGAAFGLGEATTIVFTLIAAAVAVAIVRVSRRLASTPWAISLGLLLGGALGNLTDRLFRSPGDLRGAVVDFIAVRDFSVMNLADWAISCGSVLMLLLSFRGHELGPASSSSDDPGDSGSHARHSGLNVR